VEGFYRNQFLTPQRKTGLLKELYEQYAESVYRICLKYTRNQPDAEDLVHEIFLKIRANLPGFRGGSAVFTWIYRITVNACLQHLRQQKGKTMITLEDIEVPVAAEPAGEAVESRLMINYLLRPFDRKTRAMLFMLYLEGLTQEEVAEVMQISRRAVNKRLHRFREHIAKLKRE
jgi:RNA polymerase sigma-70 factor (ECF subfamily)